MKAGWVTVPLGEIAELRGRIGWKGLTAKEYTETGPLFLSVHSLNYGDYVDFRDAFHITQERYDESPEIMLQRDDILICKDGAGIGKLGIVREVDEHTTINSSLLLIRPNARVVPKYLYYCLLSPYFQQIVQSRLEGATTPHLYQRDIVTFPVFFPPLEEQLRIVAVLDEAFEGLTRARAHAEANLLNAKELFESIKANALDYKGPDRETVVLSDVADVTSGLVDPREATYADLPHVGAGNMITGSDELVGVLTAREERLISGKYLFDETMVLYSKIRPYLRKAARPDFGGLCSADVYPVAPKQGRLNRGFLFHMLLGNDFTEYAISGSDRAGMPKVNRNHMFAYTFDLPPLEAQQTIAAIIDEAHIACSELTEHAKVKLQSLDDLRQSLLKKAFACEL